MASTALSEQTAAVEADLNYLALINVWRPIGATVQSALLARVEAHGPHRLRRPGDARGCAAPAQYRAALPRFSTRRTPQAAPAG
jgi:hypothetical protein